MAAGGASLPILPKDIWAEIIRFLPHNALMGISVTSHYFLQLARPMLRLKYFDINELSSLSPTASLFVDVRCEAAATFLTRLTRLECRSAPSNLPAFTRLRSLHFRYNTAVLPTSTDLAKLHLLEELRIPGSRITLTNFPWEALSRLSALETGWHPKKEELRAFPESLNFLKVAYGNYVSELVFLCHLTRLQHIQIEPPSDLTPADCLQLLGHLGALFPKLESAALMSIIPNPIELEGKPLILTPRASPPLLTSLTFQLHQASPINAFISHLPTLKRLEERHMEGDLRELKGPTRLQRVSLHRLPKDWQFPLSLTSMGAANDGDVLPIPLLLPLTNLREASSVLWTEEVEDLTRLKSLLSLGLDMGNTFSKALADNFFAPLSTLTSLRYLSFYMWNDDGNTDLFPSNSFENPLAFIEVLRKLPGLESVTWNHEEPIESHDLKALLD